MIVITYMFMEYLHELFMNCWGLQWSIRDTTVNMCPPSTFIGLQHAVLVTFDLTILIYWTLSLMLDIVLVTIPSLVFMFWYNESNCYVYISGLVWWFFHEVMIAMLIDRLLQSTMFSMIFPFLWLLKLCLHFNKACRSLTVYFSFWHNLLTILLSRLFQYNDFYLCEDILSSLPYKLLSQIY